MDHTDLERQAEHLDLCAREELETDDPDFERVGRWEADARRLRIAAESYRDRGSADMGAIPLASMDDEAAFLRAIREAGDWQVVSTGRGILLRPNPERDPEPEPSPGVGVFAGRRHRAEVRATDGSLIAAREFRSPAAARGWAEDFREDLKFPNTGAAIREAVRRLGVPYEMAVTFREAEILISGPRTVSVPALLRYRKLLVEALVAAGVTRDMMPATRGEPRPGDRARLQVWQQYHRNDAEGRRCGVRFEVSEAAEDPLLFAKCPREFADGLTPGWTERPGFRRPVREEPGPIGTDDDRVEPVASVQ